MREVPDPQRVSQVYTVRDYQVFSQSDYLETEGAPPPLLVFICLF